LLQVERFQVVAGNHKTLKGLFRYSLRRINHHFRLAAVKSKEFEIKNGDHEILWLALLDTHSNPDWMKADTITLTNTTPIYLWKKPFFEVIQDPRNQNCESHCFSQLFWKTSSEILDIGTRQSISLHCYLAFDDDGFRHDIQFLPVAIPVAEASRMLKLINCGSFGPSRTLFTHGALLQYFWKKMEIAIQSANPELKKEMKVIFISSLEFVAFFGKGTKVSNRHILGIELKKLHDSRKKIRILAAHHEGSHYTFMDILLVENKIDFFFVDPFGKDSSTALQDTVVKCIEKILSLTLERSPSEWQSNGVQKDSDTCAWWCVVLAMQRLALPFSSKEPPASVNISVLRSSFLLACQDLNDKTLLHVYQNCIGTPATSSGDKLPSLPVPLPTILKTIKPLQGDTPVNPNPSEDLKRTGALVTGKEMDQLVVSTRKSKKQGDSKVKEQCSGVGLFFCSNLSFQTKDGTTKTKGPLEYLTSSVEASLLNPPSLQVTNNLPIGVRDE